MRLGIDYSAAINQRAGIGRYARGVLGALISFAERDYVLSVAPRPNAKAYDGVLPLFAHGRNVALPLSERLLWIAWHRARLPLAPDLLARSLDAFYNPDFLLPRLAYAPGVPTIHDLGFLTVPDCAFPKLRLHLERAVPWSVARSALVMAVSEHTKSDIVRLLGVSPERVRVAPNAVDAVFRPVESPQWRDAERRRLSLPPRFLLAVGTLEPRKNLVRLLDAVALLRDRGKTLPLVVVGREGWLYEPIYEAAARHGLERDGQVRFLRDAGDRDLLALYNLARVMVYPSLYEGFGLPPLEALACGGIVVASNASSLPEVLGEAALLVDPYDVEGLADAIERAWDDDGLRADLASRGPARATCYSWSHSARAVYDALRESAGLSAIVSPFDETGPDATLSPAVRVEGDTTATPSHETRLGRGAATTPIDGTGR